MSPLLFNIYAEAMMEEALEGIEEGIKIGGILLKDVRFADDQSMVAGSEIGLQKIMDSLTVTAERYGMKINIKKTKVMRVSKKGGEINITINGTKLEQVKSFKYLGHTITDDGRCETEIKCRIEQLVMFCHVLTGSGSVLLISAAGIRRRSASPPRTVAS